MNKVHYSSIKEDWETPQSLFDDYNRVYKFVVDAAASDTNTKCANWLTKEQDALNASWNIGNGNVWLNPPYGRITAKFVEKAYNESLTGISVVCLLPARTDTKWFHDYCYKYSDIRFLRGRLKFSNSKNSAPFPSMICVFGLGTV